MSSLRSIITGLRNLFFHKRASKELEDEIDSYVDSAVADGVSRGMTDAEARRSARLDVGGTDAVKERTGTIGWERIIESVVQDVGFALRMMRKSPLTTAVTILTLALGIGANSAMFGIVYGLLFRPLPFPDEDRIAIVHMHFAPQNNPRGNMSLADFVDLRSSTHSFEKVAAYSPTRFVLSGSNDPEEVSGALVTADYFAVLGTAPELGHTFQEGDDSATAPAKIVISESLWRRRFQRATDVVGRIQEVNGTPATIIGVVRSSYGFPRPDIDVWRNQTLKITRRGPFFYHGIGRLRAGVDTRQAMAETDILSHVIESGSPTGYSHLSMPIEPLHEFLVGRIRPTLLIIFAAVGLVLLLAIFNVANLLLARATARQREIATRLSLGATRGRLIQQLLTESVLMSLGGGACGLILAEIVVMIFRSVNPTTTAFAYQAQIDWRVLVFTVATSVVAGVAFGLGAALHSSTSNVQAGLAEGGRSQTSGRSHKKMRTTLVLAEVAISLVLVQCAGLLLRSFVQLQRADTGVTTPAEEVLTMVISPATSRNTDPQVQSDQLGRFYQRAVEDLSSYPGVEHVAIADSLPPTFSGEDDTFRIAGQPWSEQAFPSTSLPRVTPDFFLTFGIPLVRGRVFTGADTATSEPVTIISDSLARRYFPNVDPIGQKLGASGPGNSDPFMTIVGVVGDVKYWGLDVDSKPAYYVPMVQNPTSQVFVIVRGKDVSGLGPSITQRLRSLDAGLVVRRVMTLQDVIDESVAQPRIRTVVLGAFGVLALLIAAVGIYGVIAYSVTERTQEIGIRMALGADRSAVLRMIMRNGVALSLAGITIGLVAAVISNRAVTPFLFATSQADPLTIAASCSVLFMISLAATLVPAFRATRIEPNVALRND
jgi:predicted permease